MRIRPMGLAMAVLAASIAAGRADAGADGALALEAGHPAPPSTARRALGAIDSGYRAAAAQEGHPLSGTWGGEWRGGGGERTRVTLVMSWDGKAVSGIINPGPDAIPLTSVVVDWADWTLRLAAERKDAAGRMVSVAAEGRLEDIGSYDRKIVGTWTQDGISGELVLVRE